MILHTPSDEEVAAANLTAYLRAQGFEAYDEAWRWSVDDLDGFWASMWDWFDVPGTRGPTVLADRTMPGARWFPEAELNYVEQALRWDDDRPAVEFRAEPGGRPAETITHRDLRRRVAEVAAGLRRLGVGRGDRVAAYAPNVPETLIAFLATASLGAIWSSCSPDFGVTAVLDRFRQIEPKVLIAAEGYLYRGKWFDRRAEVAELQRSLPSLEAVVNVDLSRPNWPCPGRTSWSSASPSPTPCGSSTRRGRRGCPRPWSTGTGASSSSTSRPSRCTTTWAGTIASSGSRRPAG